MEKVQQNHRSPKCVISLDKTPTVVGGNLELFGNITDMISQWEGMEGKEERAVGDYLLDKRSRKRLSKVIRKLSGRFKEKEECHESQPDVMCRGEGE